MINLFIIWAFINLLFIFKFIIAPVLPKLIYKFITYPKLIKKEKIQVETFYKDILKGLYVQYDLAVDKINTEKMAFLLHNIAVIKYSQNDNNVNNKKGKNNNGK